MNATVQPGPKRLDLPLDLVHQLARTDTVRRLRLKRRRRDQVEALDLPRSDDPAEVANRLHRHLCAARTRHVQPVELIHPRPALRRGLDVHLVVLGVEIEVVHV